MNSIRIPLLIAALSATSFAQTQWTQIDRLSFHSRPRMVRDTHLDRIVLVSPVTTEHGARMWEFDGREWQLLGPAPNRREFGLVYDQARREIVMFGGTTLNGDLTNTTFLFDGTAWRDSGATTAPSPRRRSAMCYEPDSRGILLFGGVESTIGELNDTWSWDGTNWTQLAVTAPPQRAPYPALVADEWTGTLALIVTDRFSQQRTVVIHDWIQGGWVERTLATRMLSEEYAAAWCGARRSILIYGRQSLNYDAREVQGSQVAMVPTDPHPYRSIVSLVDASDGSVLLFGGETTTIRFSDTWRYDSRWTLLDAGMPAPRIHAAIAFDERRGVTVLQGGDGGNDVLQRSTFEWDGVDCRVIPEVPTQDRGLSAAMVYDTVRGVCVAYGANSTGSHTWEWDGVQWTKCITANAPSPRKGVAMAFDRHRGVTVLFGGQLDIIGSVVVADLWEFDGIDWREVTPNVSPPPRLNAGMAYDRHRRVLVMAGGTRPPSFPALRDTWEFDGTAWTQRQPATTPLLDTKTSLVEDPIRRRMVSLGFDPAPPGAERTWEWDGTDWQMRAAAWPTLQRGGAMAYDAVREGIWYFGGAVRNTTPASATFQFYAPIANATFASMGAPCGRPTPGPRLTPAPDSRPWLGDQLAIEFAPIPARTPLVVAIGGSTSSWNGIPLPLDLAPFGAPTCVLRCSGDIFDPLVDLGGRAVWAVQIPPLPPLAGQLVHAQGLVFDVGANPLGLSTTQLLTLRIGGR